jgi:Glycosyl transferases group 1
LKILILCDHYPLSPRVNKIRNSLIKINPNYEVKVFAWNRSNKKVQEDYVFSLNQNLGYGNKIKLIINLFRFILQTKKFIKKYEPEIIHSIDFTMLLVAACLSKKEKLIYEIYDIKFIGNKIINKIREKIEFLIIKKYVESMILASPYFNYYYKKNGSEVSGITINNKPLKELNVTSTNNNLIKKNEEILKNNIVIGFIGTIRYKEILLNLINASKKLDNITILLAGGGPDFEFFKDFILKNDLQSKVMMTGAYTYSDLPAVYNLCDYVWAAYPNKDLNVKYAISNKFFESIIFKKKVIVSEATKVGENVLRYNYGYTVNPYSVSNIEKLFKKIEKNYVFNIEFYFGEGLYWEDEETELTKVYK